MKAKGKSKEKEKKNEREKVKLDNGILFLFIFLFLAQAWGTLKAWRKLKLRKWNKEKGNDAKNNKRKSFLFFFTFFLLEVLA